MTVLLLLSSINNDINENNNSNVDSKSMSNHQVFDEAWIMLSQLAPLLREVTNINNK